MVTTNALEVAMKWIVLAAVTLLSTACVNSTTEIVEYQQVNVVNVINPGIYDMDDPEPMDVTTTTVDYY